MAPPDNYSGGPLKRLLRALLAGQGPGRGQRGSVHCLPNQDVGNGEGFLRVLCAQLCQVYVPTTQGVVMKLDQ